MRRFRYCIPKEQSPAAAAAAVALRKRAPMGRMEQKQSCQRQPRTLWIWANPKDNARIRCETCMPMHRMGPARRIWLRPRFVDAEVRSLGDSGGEVWPCAAGAPPIRRGPSPGLRCVRLVVAPGHSPVAMDPLVG